MPQINYTQRLKLCLQEFWLLNKSLILLLPFGILGIFVIALLWPGNFINTLLFEPSSAANSDYIVDQMQNGKSINFLINSLALIVILAIISQHHYLVSLKNKQNYLLRPFTNGQRIITLYAYTLLFIGIGVCCIYILDQILVQTMRSAYAEKTSQLLTDNGFLYVDYGRSSFFTAYPSKYYFTFGMLVLLLTPLSHMMYFLFKKYSPLWSSVCIVAFLGTLILVFNKTRPYTDQVAQVEVYPNITDYLFTLYALIIGLLFIAAFHESLKEREV